MRRLPEVFDVAMRLSIHHIPEKVQQNEVRSLGGAKRKGCTTLLHSPQSAVSWHQDSLPQLDCVPRELPRPSHNCHVHR